MKVLITGGAGFIGSYLVDEFMERGDNVTVIDDLSSGSLNNLKQWIDNLRFKFLKADLKTAENWIKEFESVDCVLHFAANPEVKVSIIEPKVHFNENLLTTFNVLEACKHFKIPYLIFASTSTVYGDANKIPTPEDYAPLKPISVYGAIKLSCEILVETYSRLYGIRSLILRYANIVGPRSRHGVIIDFINKLRSNKKVLEILGDGSQKKSYLYIDDAVKATIKAMEWMFSSDKLIEIFNIGNEDWISVKEVADIIVRSLGLNDVKYVYKPATYDGRGWPGDVKRMLLDITKITTMVGWRPKLNSQKAIEMTVRGLIERGI
ncbi:MAG: NAD-dependent epimerase/dehydratase family protein [Candidatus Methanomethyliaceae archaeon]|nr:NAD-dependent epimerase/dehydratase family protein [Candidatus Methanomethyliaceae archaeon]